MNDSDPSLTRAKWLIGCAVLRSRSARTRNPPANRPTRCSATRMRCSSSSIYNPENVAATRTRLIATRDAPPFPDSDMNARPSLTRAKWLIGCAVASIALGAHAQPPANRPTRCSATRMRCSSSSTPASSAGRRGPVREGAHQQDQFAADMQHARQSVGTVSRRGWAGHAHPLHECGDDARRALRERRLHDHADERRDGLREASFRLEDDGAGT